MKPRSGCDECRRRHIKCVTEHGSERCASCLERGIDCEREPRFTFKHSSLSTGSTSGPTSKRRLRKPPHGDYTRNHSSFRRTLSQSADQHGAPVAVEPSRINQATPRRSSTRLLSSSQPDADFSVSPATPYIDLQSTNARGDPTTPTTLEARSSSLVLSAETRSNLQFEISKASSHRSSRISSTVNGWQSLLSQRETELLRIFVQYIAPSSDACNEANHFTTVVPRIALGERILLYGIFAVASKYDSLKNSSPGLEATFYHDKQIELLIESLNKPPDTYDTVLLCAVVISRLYEEYDPDEDAFQFHLQGTSKLLSHTVIAGFVESGGLAEAASWLHLRQAIYGALVKHTPIKVRLENFTRSTAFKREDDGAYANRAVYLLAKCLRLFFPISETNIGTDESPASVSTHGDADYLTFGWEDVNTEIDLWFESRPRSFQSLYTEPSCLILGQPFPKIQMLAAANVVGMQYYHAAKILYHLNQLSAPSHRMGFEAAKLRRDNERSINLHLGTVIGLADSNPQVLNAFFLPPHILSFCGYCLNEPLEREHSIKFLHRANKAVAWKVNQLAELLISQWRELDEIDQQ